MFYYLNPAFRNNEGHHLTHQHILHKLYGSNFCVVANRSLKIDQELPYPVKTYFSNFTRAYLSSQEQLLIFEKEINQLSEFVTEHDTLFLYLGDILFVYPFLNAKIKGQLKGKVIINLFHTGENLFKNKYKKDLVASLLKQSKALRNKYNIHLLVETEQLQEALKVISSDWFDILPMFHSEQFKVPKKATEQTTKKIVSYLSASKPRGLEIFVQLMFYIQENAPTLFNEYKFIVRLVQPNEATIKLVNSIAHLIDLQIGAVSFAEYQQLILQTDIMLMPYLSNLFYAGTSGVFSDSVMNEITVVTTENTWLGYHTKRLKNGEVFTEGDKESFFNAFNKVAKDNKLYKLQAVQAAKVWQEYHNPLKLKQLFEKEVNRPKQPININKVDKKYLKKVATSHKKLKSVFFKIGIYNKFYLFKIAIKYKLGLLK